MSEILENLDKSEKMDFPSPRAVGRPRLLVGEPKNLIVQLEIELHTKFKSYCAIRGVKMSDLVRKWITEFLSRGESVEMIAIGDKLQAWLEDYQHSPGATLDQVLAKFRELQAEVESGGNE